MKICFVVRSISHQLPTYTTIHLAYEAFLRGHQVYFASIHSFSYSDDKKIRAYVVSYSSDFKMPLSREAFLREVQQRTSMREEICLSDVDVVFFRYNPYEDAHGNQDVSKSPLIAFGRLLRQHGVFVINDPGGLIKAASKMYVSAFPESVRAKTLITRNATKIKQFLRRLKKPAILKPLSGYGGTDVFFVEGTHDINLNQIIAAVSKNGYVVAQEFLPAVKKGDKRLLLLQGAPIVIDNKVAIYKRMSPQGEIRSNMHVGGRRKRTRFTELELAIVESVKMKLIADGLYFVGIDIVGNKILEVNAFCPGGIHNINELCGINVGEYVISHLESHTQIWKAQRRGTSLESASQG